GARRPIAEPVLAVANGLLWGAAGWRFGAHLSLLVYLAFFSTVLVLSCVDLATYLLPNRITYPALVGSSTAIVVVSVLSLEGQWCRGRGPGQPAPPRRRRMVSRGPGTGWEPVPDGR